MVSMWIIKIDLMYLFKIVFHAWENHNDRDQSPKQQQEGES